MTKRVARWQDTGARRREQARAVAPWVERAARQQARADRLEAARIWCEGAAGFVAGLALVAVALWALVAGGGA